ncbi:MAG: response regulator [Sulfuricurvum sp.]|nr:response regulator [Sulfuricurvum sp.]
MDYTDLFKEKFLSSVGMLTSCANLHSDPFLYTYLSGEILGANKPLLSLFGEDHVVGISAIEEWLKPQGVELSFLLSQSGEYRGKVTAQGKEYDIAIRSEVILLGDEPIIAIVLRDTSVIERARAAERYFDQFKKKFLTNMSHEFRTPMNAIIGFTDLLKGTPLSSWQQEYVDMVSKSASSMMRNIENLLELMQVESGSIHATLQVFAPIETFETFSVQFKELAETKEIQLMFLIDPRLPKTMTGDQDKILTILRNLIQNAIKFTNENGQVLVEIIIVKMENRSIEVEYAVSDTGIGIDAEHIKTLLRPFASAWENQRRGKDGLGIGLSLSHKYVDMMNSHLMLASQEGIGSRFSFRITHKISEVGSFEFIEGTQAALYSHDLASAQSALLHKYLDLFNIKTTTITTLVNRILFDSNILFMDTPHISSSQIESLKMTYPELEIVPIVELEYSGKADLLLEVVKSVVTLPLLPSSLHKTLSVVWNTMPKEYIDTNVPFISRKKEIKILVAEDNLINLRLLETILVQQNFKVTAVDNGQKAVDAYLKEPFDLVLMDIDMPVMDGLTANRLIKEIDKRDDRGATPVIALTAHALIGDRERIIGAGLDAHLAKPIDKNFLLQTIERYLKIAQDGKHTKSV